MGEGTLASRSMTEVLLVPSIIEEIINGFDRSDAAFIVTDVQQALFRARRELRNLTEAETLGALAEVLAFALVGDSTDSGPWGTWYSPQASGEDEDGKPIYFPDIADANADVIQHWRNRVAAVRHPVLRARYADLVWEMTSVITTQRRDHLMARCAIDAYLSQATYPGLTNLRDRLDAALRAIDLGCQIGDRQRTVLVKDLLLTLHREAVETGKGPWWLVYDRLMQDNSVWLNNSERDALVESMEGLVVHFGDTSDPAKFNPNDLEAAAGRLIRYYTRLKRPDAVRRLHAAVACGFEHFAAKGDTMVASSVLQTAVNAYRDAGMSKDSKRLRVLMQEKIRQARTQMPSIVTEVKVPREELDNFCEAIVDEDLVSTFTRLATAFLPNKLALQERVSETLKHAPLFAHMPQTVMAHDHVAATVGSVQDDPHGRLLQQTAVEFDLSDIWLEQALGKLFDTHELSPEHFVGWANRLGIFEDMSFLLEGVRAWFAGDLVKAVHVLVPQAECGLRGIVGQLGHPVTKAHPTVEGAGVALTMGDILYSKESSEALGPDLTLYFQALFADPRGMNLRNDVAHGLIKRHQVTEHRVRLLIHSLLVFGAWKELSSIPRQRGS